MVQAAETMSSSEPATMSLIGLKIAGIPGAIASALTTFGPPCVMYFVAYRLWDRSAMRLGNALCDAASLL